MSCKIYKHTSEVLPVCFWTILKGITIFFGFPVCVYIYIYKSYVYTVL